METKDASTNFYFENLTKGTFVFEYKMKVNSSGIFNTGITSVKSMYLPQINAYTENEVININN